MWLRLCEAMHAVPSLSIHSLRIPNSNIGEKGCKEFEKLCFHSKLQEIEDLDLSGNRIGSSGFCSLFRTFQLVDAVSRIRFLDLSKNRIGAQGVKDAYAHLKQCYFRNLETLRLGCGLLFTLFHLDNPLNKRWIQMILNVFSFHSLPNLHCLDLSGSPLRAAFTRRNQIGRRGNDRTGCFAAKQHRAVARRAGAKRLRPQRARAEPFEFCRAGWLRSDAATPRPLPQRDQIEGSPDPSQNAQRRVPPQSGNPGFERKPHRK